VVSASISDYQSQSHHNKRLSSKLKSAAIDGKDTVTTPASKLEIPVTHATEVMMENVCPLLISLGEEVGPVLNLAFAASIELRMRFPDVDDGLLTADVESCPVVCAKVGAASEGSSISVSDMLTSQVEDSGT
jgi:hypothetical protein